MFVVIKEFEEILSTTPSQGLVETTKFLLFDQQAVDLIGEYF